MKLRKVNTHLRGSICMDFPIVLASPKTPLQCFQVFQQMSCGANFGANVKSSYKKVIKLTCNCLIIKCFHLGLNQGPLDYESSALTN